RQAASSERGFLRSPWMSSTPMRVRFASRSSFAVGRTSARTRCPPERSWRQISPPKPTGPVAPTTRYIASAALPGLRVQGLHSCLDAFENHRILERQEVIEGSLFKRVFAEESEYPPRTDILAAREWDVLTR